MTPAATAPGDANLSDATGVTSGVLKSKVLPTVLEKLYTVNHNM